MPVITLKQALDTRPPRGFLLDSNAISAILRKEQKGIRFCEMVAKNRRFTTHASLVECALEVDRTCRAAKARNAEIRARVHIVDGSREIVRAAFGIFLEKRELFARKGDSGDGSAAEPSPPASPAAAVMLRGSARPRGSAPRALRRR